MKYNPKIHHRRSIRLKGYDYSKPGAYYITVCTKNRVGAKQSKNNIIEQLFQNASPLQGRPKGTRPGSLSSIMQNYISITTRKINQIRKTPGKKLWQRNFYEHIIRNDNELNKIREYIIHNPLMWDLDRNNPINWKQTNDR